MAGDGRRIGLYGFGAAAHILAQIVAWQGREVYAFTKEGDEGGQQFARSLGCRWAGGSTDLPPEELDAAIIFAPVGSLVPAALKAVRKGGKVVCAGIHMRSEEHTSELQSLMRISYAVFCLKKKIPR